MVSRQYADWELCAENMSGIHTWTIRPGEIGKRTGTPAQREGKQPYVACNRCGAEPPTMHRVRLYAELEAGMDLLSKQRRMSELMRKARGR